MLASFSARNNDATFPVNKFFAGTVIFPRVNPATKVRGLYIFTGVRTSYGGIARYLQEPSRVYEKRTVGRDTRNLTSTR